MVLFSFIWLLDTGFLQPDIPAAQKHAADGKFRWPRFGMAFYQQTFDVLRDFEKIC
jgi:hypothetical protein